MDKAPAQPSPSRYSLSAYCMPAAGVEQNRKGHCPASLVGKTDLKQEFRSGSEECSEKSQKGQGVESGGGD